MLLPHPPNNQKKKKKLKTKQNQSLIALIVS